MQSCLRSISRTATLKLQSKVCVIAAVFRKMELFVGSEHSDLYQKYRPTYPPALYKFIVEFFETVIGTMSSALNVGCGTGHSTRPLCDYFGHVTGIDISETQIQAARAAHTRSNLSFMTSEGERLGSFSDGSLDLVTVAQAMHWIDQEPFYREEKRFVIDRKWHRRPLCQYISLSQRIFRMMKRKCPWEKKGC